MRRIFLSAVFVFVSLAFFGDSVWGDVFYVSTATQLQKALTDAEANGESDIIKIAQGTYYGHFVYESSEGQHLEINGGYTSGFTGRVRDPSNTILDGSDTGQVLYLRHRARGYIIVEGLTIQNGSSSGVGGGLSILTQNMVGPSDGIKVWDNIIANNESEVDGGGLWAKTYSFSDRAGIISLSNNIIKDNEAAGYGGGVYAMSFSSDGSVGGISFLNNIICENSSSWGGGAYCQFFTTASGVPGGVYAGSNTISENFAMTNGGGIRVDGDDSGEIMFYNNIIWFNQATGSGEDIYLSGLTTNYGHNNDYSSMEGSWTHWGGNIDEDPLLTSDYHLEPSSPCIDAGTNSVLICSIFDMDGQFRFVDGDVDGIATIDIGADEYFFALPVFDGHDFNGNGISDISVWRPSEGKWYIKDVGGFNWGKGSDVPVNGDYDGDGTTDIAVWRPDNGKWYLRGITVTSWGAWGDIPVPGDYDGDEDSDIAVWRPSNGKWYIRGIGTHSWGTEGDIPVPGDYDGDGDTDIAVWRPSNGKWYILGIGTYSWGTLGDIPEPGDYDGDGDTDIVVWRPSNGRWYFYGAGSQAWGMLGDFPVPGDYNGDGITDIAVWRPSNGRWYLRGIGTQVWGMAGDVPLVR